MKTKAKPHRTRAYSVMNMVELKTLAALLERFRGLSFVYRSQGSYANGIIDETLTLIHETISWCDGGRR